MVNGGVNVTVAANRLFLIVVFSDASSLTLTEPKSRLVVAAVSPRLCALVGVTRTKSVPLSSVSCSVPATTPAFRS